MNQRKPAVWSRFKTATHEINFDNVDFSYVPGEPVLKHATFTVPDQKLTAIVGDSGSGKSTILNLIAKYYEADGELFQSAANQSTMWPQSVYWNKSLW